MEECCCDVETVNRLNQLQVYPLANYLTGMSYFRFFKVTANIKVQGSLVIHMQLQLGRSTEGMSILAG